MVNLNPESPQTERPSNLYERRMLQRTFQKLSKRFEAGAKVLQGMEGDQIRYSVESMGAILTITDFENAATYFLTEEGEARMTDVENQKATPPDITRLAEIVDDVEWLDRK